MNTSELLGMSVLNSHGAKGTIIEVDDYLHIQFENKVSVYQMSAFFDGFLMSENNQFQKEIEIEKEEINKKNLELEKQRMQESLERRKIEAEHKKKIIELQNQRKKAKIEKPTKKTK